MTRQQVRTLASDYAPLETVYRSVGVDRVAEKALRRMFYAGASAVVVQVIETGALQPLALVGLVDRLQTELRAFVESDLRKD